jgi:2-polyprenyl-3-methyl-5-hydroxy-6-metoxy-1,4-benzoquinol methylase
MFKFRSYTPELLDGSDIPELDLFQNLKELHFINKYLGGYRITFDALKKLIHQSNSNYSIVDIGSGGGDTLKEIYTWCISQKINTELFGIDLKQSCVNYSNQNNPKPAIKFINDDYENALKHIENIDFIHASLFCHHLNEEQIISLIHFAQKNKATLIINDLERNPIAYYSIKVLTNLFSKSYLVKNDAPLSVLRGFKKREWLAIIKQSGAHKFTVKNMWAFRHQVIIYA